MRVNFSWRRINLRYLGGDLDADVNGDNVLDIALSCVGGLILIELFLDMTTFGNSDVLVTTVATRDFHLLVDIIMMQSGNL